jgi:hypothetical protein
MTILAKNNYDLRLWLSVIRSRGIGPKTFWQLYAKDSLFKNVQTVDVSVEIEQHEQLNYALCAGFDDSYP